MVIRRNDLTGKTFGRFKVLEFSHLTKGWVAYWKVQCECGVIKAVRGASLNNGSSTSCGCLPRELLIERITTHDSTHTSEYASWGHMKARCLNPKHKHYKYYGGRGITICSEWIDSFANFLRDMGNKPSKIHTLDRIDSNLGYSPDNCRWATRKEQGRNKRNTTQIKYKGQNRSIAEIAEMNNMCPCALRSRLHLGWELEKAVSQPVRTCR